MGNGYITKVEFSDTVILLDNNHLSYQGKNIVNTNPCSILKAKLQLFITIL